MVMGALNSLQLGLCFRYTQIFRSLSLTVVIEFALERVLSHLLL